MWKLTIKQERESEHSTYPFTEKVAFTHECLAVLTFMVQKLADCTEVNETEYMIEKVGEE
jgi:hypothetical protein